MVRRTAKGNYEHPAKYSAPILARLVTYIEREVENHGRTLYLLDPFGGVGGIHRLVVAGVHMVAVEIEAEWAEESAKLGPTVHADFFDYARDVASEGGKFDVVATSVTYGNRLADHHNAKDSSRRNGYKFSLERDLTPGSSAGMQWGDEYRKFHAKAIKTIWQLLAPEGLFLLNVSDHIRKQEVQPVVAWYRGVCRREGFQILEDVVIGTRRLKYGENREARVDGEHLLVMRKVGPMKGKYKI